MNRTYISTIGSIADWKHDLLIGGCFSDMFKDAYGYRPRSIMDNLFDPECTMEAVLDTYASTYEDVIKACERDRREEEKRLASRHIEWLMVQEASRMGHVWINPEWDDEQYDDVPPFGDWQHRYETYAEYLGIKKWCWYIPKMYSKAADARFSALAELI